jgi:hypothetical protein
VKLVAVTLLAPDAFGAAGVAVAVAVGLAVAVGVVLGGTVAVGVDVAVAIAVTVSEWLAYTGLAQAVTI